VSIQMFNIHTKSWTLDNLSAKDHRWLLIWCTLYTYYYCHFQCLFNQPIFTACHRLRRIPKKLLKIWGFL